MAPTFLPTASDVDVFSFAEATVRLHRAVPDPFRTVRITALFDGKTIDGFCDAQDGSTFRVRFMPTRPGTFPYTVTLHGEEPTTFHGTFTAELVGSDGLVAIDPKHPFHFVYTGSGKHFFWNGTTAYLLPGCSDALIEAALARLARLGINRVRVALCPSRQESGGRWHEPQVAPREDFTFCYGPFLAARPESVTDPGYDVTRYDVAYYQKFERLLHTAAKHGIVVQVTFFMDAQEAQNYPFDPETPFDLKKEQFIEDADEKRYFAYTVARLAAFANVEWCITNEWKLFRPDAWAENIGAYLQQIDPYGHLLSVHGHGVFPFRDSAWATHALFQVWDEHGGYSWVRKMRAEQEFTGRIIPQINEENGYEDHYPGPWGEGRVAPARDAETRRRLAWEIAMAGGYQTTGESATSGAGGWINGIGDKDTLLIGLAHLRTFFEGIEWWHLEPATLTLADAEVFALQEDNGQAVILYFPNGTEDASLPPALTGGKNVTWFNPHTGSFAPAPDTQGDWACSIA